jgi:hypothetical protein
MLPLFRFSRRVSRPVQHPPTSLGKGRGIVCGAGKLAVMA